MCKILLGVESETRMLCQRLAKLAEVVRVERGWKLPRSSAQEEVGSVTK